MTWGVAVISGASAILLAVITWILNRGARGADTTKQIAEAAAVLVGPLGDQVEALRGEVADLRDRVNATERDRDVLAALVRRHIQWEDDGRPDPPGPPTADPEIRALLSVLRDR